MTAPAEGVELATVVPPGTPIRSIVSLTGAAVIPALLRSSTVTVLVPAPAGSVTDGLAAYACQGSLSSVPSTETRMSIMPVWASDAGRDKVTSCDVVVASPLLMVTDPSGADVSRYSV